MKTNIETLWTEKGKVTHVTKSIKVYQNPLKDINKNLYFIEYLYKNYLKIRVKLSKNQKNKYLKYGLIPSKPKELKTLSNFSYTQKSFKSYKTNNLKKLYIGKQIYICRLLNDTNISSENIFKLFVNYILY